jgi:uncharacterized BrkB/YihY/UPF0761 family membrane protein
VAARAELARRQLEQQRPTNPLVDTVFGAIQRESESGGGLLAGALAFRFFLFIIPFVFVVVMGLGLGADAAHADVRDVARRAGIAGVAAAAVENGASASSSTRWITFSIALFALVTGARNFVKALWVAHALIWRVPLQRLQHPTRTGLEFIGVVSAATLLLRATYALRSLSLLGWLLGFAVFTVVIAGTWLVCSVRVFPAPAGVTWRAVWPGAVLFGLGAQALQLMTTLWIAPSTKAKSETYGAIGAALTILLWAYLLGRLMISAAALNASRWRGSSQEPPA